MKALTEKKIKIQYISWISDIKILKKIILWQEEYEGLYKRSNRIRVCEGDMMSEAEIAMPSPQDNEYRQPLEAERGKKQIFPLVPPEWTSPDNTLILAT